MKATAALLLVLAACASPIDSTPDTSADAGRFDAEAETSTPCSCEQGTIAGWPWCFVCSSLACSEANETIAAHDCALNARELPDGSYQCCLFEAP